MKSSCEIEQELRSIVAKVGRLPLTFNKSANLYLDLGVASIEALQLLMELEEHFAVQVSDADFVEACDLEQLTEMITRLLQQQSAGDFK